MALPWPGPGIDGSSPKSGHEREEVLSSISHGLEVMIKTNHWREVPEERSMSTHRGQGCQFPVLSLSPVAKAHNNLRLYVSDKNSIRSRASWSQTNAQRVYGRWAVPSK